MKNNKKNESFYGFSFEGFQIWKANKLFKIFKKIIVTSEENLSKAKNFLFPMLFGEFVLLCGEFIDKIS